MRAMITFEIFIILGVWCNLGIFVFYRLTQLRIVYR